MKKRAPRSPAAVARDEWSKSVQGQFVADTTYLNAYLAGVILGRVKDAYLAGYAAGERAAQGKSGDVLIDAFAGVLGDAKKRAAKRKGTK